MRHLIAAALIAAPLASPQAGVIYNWEQVTPDTLFGNFTSFIEFSVSAWSQGGTFAAEGSSPISHLSSRIDNVAADFDATQGRLSDWTYVPCSTSQDFCNFHGLDPADEFIANPLWTFNVLGVFAGDFLVGFDGPSSLRHAIAFNDQSHSYVMTFAPDGLWHFEDVGSDEANLSCPFLTPCTGSGRWVLDQSTVPVPEPAPLAIMGTAALALAAWGSRRRRA